MEEYLAMQPRLIFNRQTFTEIRHGRSVKPDNQADEIITKILLQHKGPVKHFYLDLSYIDVARHSKVDQWMFYLSRHGVRELVLWNSSKPTDLCYLRQPMEPYKYRLSSCVFSCSSLKQLVLTGVIIKSCFYGSLDILTNLYFSDVSFESNLSGVSSCLSIPKLGTLNFDRCIGVHHLHIVALSLRLLRIYSSPDARLNNFLNTNLFKLNFSLCKEVAQEHGFNLSKLLEMLPKVQDLQLDGFALKFLAIGTAPTMLPVTVECLDHLTLDDIDFTDLDQVSALICLLQSGLNLRLFYLKVLHRTKSNDREGVLSYLKDPNCFKENLSQLKNVKIYLNRNADVELMLLKLILARSPSLEKIIIADGSYIVEVEGFRIARELLAFPRASPNANIKWNPRTTYAFDDVFLFPSLRKF